MVVVGGRVVVVVAGAQVPVGPEAVVVAVAGRPVLARARVAAVAVLVAGRQRRAAGRRSAEPLKFTPGAAETRAAEPLAKSSVLDYD